MASGTHLYEDPIERFTRSLTLSVVVGVAFLILLLRLVQVQIVEADRNQRLSKENRMQLHVLTAPRGFMLDRNGTVLARNRPSYSICVLPYKLRKVDKVVANLCSIRDSNGTAVFEEEGLREKIRVARYRRFDVSRLKDDVSLELVSIIEEHALDLPGIVVETEARREYPLGPAAFHVLGYMGEIPEAQFDTLREVGYKYGDLIGRSGLEHHCEDYFRGKHGQEYVEVNAYGKRMGAIEDMPRSPPTPGQDVVLTLDARLQQTAYEAFADTLCGAVVAIDPRNGQVLAMMSKPSVDPNIFSLASSLRSKGWQAVALDSTRPLNNRAVTGIYSPGSTFKLVTALAGLASGRIDASTRMSRPCTGAYRIGRLLKHCWFSGGHGYLDVTRAIQKSCNVYFYQLGLLLGDSLINYYAHQTGLGDRTGIGLPHEAKGWLSGEKLYNERHKSRGWKWTDGLVCDHAIGQSQYVTPVQLARMVAVLANGGRLFRPQLIKEVRTHGGDLAYVAEPEIIEEHDWDSATVAILHKGMRMVLEPGGTARRARVPDIVVGGKTGSAEWKKGELTHGLFVGCAPMENPEIAIAVVVEKAGHGGAVAAPVAGAVLNCYFDEVAPRDTADVIVEQAMAGAADSETM
jgi:penicillin-binding protein 2